MKRHLRSCFDFCLLPDGTPALLDYSRGGCPELLPIFGGDLVYSPRDALDRLHERELEAHGHVKNLVVCWPNAAHLRLKNRRIGQASHPKKVVDFVFEWAAFTFVRHVADVLMAMLRWLQLRFVEGPARGGRGS